MTIVPLAEVPSAAIEALLDRAFGADRRSRTAYRLRAATRQVEPLSLAALADDGALLGTIQCWPVHLVGDSGEETPMILVGPVAVEPGLQRGGIGRALTQTMLERAERTALAGTDALMLIGDPEYYGRFFGFSAERTRGWRLPGPFELRRLLARGSGVPDEAGDVLPRL